MKLIDSYPNLVLRPDLTHTEKLDSDPNLQKKNADPDPQLRLRASFYSAKVVVSVFPGTGDTV